MNDVQCFSIPPLFAAAIMVCSGYYGDGETRKERLKKDGYDPVRVQQIVNKILPIIREC